MPDNHPSSLSFSSLQPSATLHIGRECHRSFLHVFFRVQFLLETRPAIHPTQPREVISPREKWVTHSPISLFQDGTNTQGVQPRKWTSQTEIILGRLVDMTVSPVWRRVVMMARWSVRRYRCWLSSLSIIWCESTNGNPHLHCHMVRKKSISARTADGESINCTQNF